MNWLHAHCHKRIAALEADRAHLESKLEDLRRSYTLLMDKLAARAQAQPAAPAVVAPVRAANPWRGFYRAMPSKERNAVDWKRLGFDPGEEE